MTRRRWLVTYDVVDEKRRRKVHDTMCSFGEALQFSVFLCDMDSMEKVALLTELRDHINKAEDSVALVDLGEPGRPTSSVIEFLGPHRELPRDGPTII